MNKYYTPSIEEFHIGFEFEVNYGENDWVKESLYAKPQVVTLPYMKLENIRVKYLDSEDIESFGFKYTGKSIDIWFKKEGNFNIGSWTSYEIKLHYGLHDNRLYIIAMDCGDEYKLFEGKIKNKSELKVLLKQLGII